MYSPTLRLLLTAWLSAAALWVAGCDSEPETEAVAKFPAARISPRNTWTIKGDMGDIAAAIDGNGGTAAVSSALYANSMIVLDLGKTCMFNTVILEHGDEMGYCRRLSVATSIDGKTYTQRMMGPGNRKTTIVSMITPVLARYVQIKAVIPGNAAWSISEIDLQ
ncbi:MAG: discoidin domain-containing protein [Planctomycetaceae bacterium]|nr:discoidin domain-containing protein [Planctomycetaceae bacterium]